METKWCSAGQHEVAVEMFWRRQGHLQPNCKSCQSKINKERYSKYKKRHQANVRANTKKRMDNFQLWKQTLKCKICGESYTRCLDFHHVDPKHKKFTISEAFWRKGFGVVVEEIQKCVVLCSNCHRKVHDGVVSVNENQQCDTAALVEIMGA